MDGSLDFQDEMGPDPSDLCHSKPRIWPNIVEIPISAFFGGPHRQCLRAKGNPQKNYPYLFTSYSSINEGA